MTTESLPTNPRVWRFFGIPRSGNHAIIEWFMGNIDVETTIFLNNCREGDPFTGFSYCNFVYNGHLRKHRANIHREKNHHFHRLLDKRSSATDLIISYEIMSPRPEERARLHAESGINAQPTADFLIIRSPLNLIASSLTKLRNEITRPPRLRKSLEHLEAWLPGTYQAYLQTASEDDVHPVIYDQWGADQTYRKDILESVGLDPKRLDLGAMTTAGGGSSFDRQQDVDTISKSKRWQRYVEDPDFLRLVAALLNADTDGLIEAWFPDDWTEAQDL
ncbi:hypothetical protein MUY21_12655 [Aliiroseovarius sp. S2029]|uniref:hypothetical protein n=1 Tax=Aliiroseovarius sp. S2029 TaxID=2936988 RepID=UPI0020C15303|nr:hypothetical protein [Aliiroseovarius sp. S2029]MCK8484889.1 hypothetical protein [Aliiroseovarius sp. S2029]